MGARASRPHHVNGASMASLTCRIRIFNPPSFNKPVSFSIIILIPLIESAMRICGRDARAPGKRRRGETPCRNPCRGQACVPALWMGAHTGAPLRFFLPSSRPLSCHPGLDPGSLRRCKDGSLSTHYHELRPGPRYAKHVFDRSRYLHRPGHSVG